MAADMLFDYAAEVLAFDFKAAEPVEIPAPPEPAQAARLAERCRAAFTRSGKAGLVLLGLGAGALAEALAASLPAGTVVVCEQDLGLARGLKSAGRLGWWRRAESSGSSARLALDASPWAVLLLLDRAGVDLENVFVLPNPELPPAAKARLRSLELLLTRSRLLALPQQAPAPRLSAAAILAPTEPALPEFFAQFPAWLHELVLVWDADVVPDIVVPAHLPVRQSARRLENDFSAQRNAMLEGCGGDFICCLDADERLSPEGWAALPRLCAVAEVGGWHFPRVTPYPDQRRALAGFGLWPDIQLRLFRRVKGLSYFNPVHERLTGICGGQALALDVEIEHLSRLRKDEAELRRKLEGFDAAGAGRVRHALSAEYPSVPRGLLASRRAERPRGLLLPPELA